MVKKIIVDSSPLIILLKSDLEHILPELFEEVLVPDAVWQEVSAGSKYDAARQKLPLLISFKQISVENSDEAVKNHNLGDGESAVLNLALTSSDSAVMLDDFAARKCAKILNIPFLGTGGALIIAKQKGLITSVSEALTRVRKEGLWLSDEIIELIKQKAGE